MRIKVDGHEIEGDASDLKRLIFGSNGAGQMPKEAQEPASQESKEKTIFYHRHKKKEKKHRVLSAEVAQGRRERMKALNEKIREIAKKEGISYKEASKRIKKSQAQRTCAICHTTLLSGRKPKYCSPACAKKGQLQKIREWKKNHRESMRRSVNVIKVKKKAETGKLPKYVLVDKSEQRRAWIQTRAKSLCHEYALSYEKALEQARAEWDYKFKKKASQKKDFVVDDFPKFDRISGNALSVLESMFKHMIGTHGRLNYFTITPSVALDGGESWNGRIWHDFVAEVLLKSQKIVDYFNVKGKIERFVDPKGHEYLLYVG